MLMMSARSKARATRRTKYLIASGSVWFRGHRQCNLSLQPGLYRSETIEKLVKTERPSSKHDEEFLFDELMDLEHEQRIDFISYGHLLNAANQAKTQIDWYFLMQHH